MSLSVETSTTSDSMLLCLIANSDEGLVGRCKLAVEALAATQAEVQLRCKLDELDAALAAAKYDRDAATALLASTEIKCDTLLVEAGRKIEVLMEKAQAQADATISLANARQSEVQAAIDSLNAQIVASQQAQVETMQELSRRQAEADAARQDAEAVKKAAQDALVQRQTAKAKLDAKLAAINAAAQSTDSE